MSSQSQVILGISPVNIRLAFEYIKRGIGWHAISHPWYDMVQVTEVTELAKLSTPPAGVEYGAVLRVSFYKGGGVVRFIDFSTLCTGGGGDPAIKLMES